MRHLRQALRRLRRAPGYAPVPVATLALGLGAITAVFSLVDAVLLRPLPYGDADRLVRLWSSYPERDVDRGTVSPADLEDWRGQSRHIRAMGGFSGNRSRWSASCPAARACRVDPAAVIRDE